MPFQLSDDLFAMVQQAVAPIAASERAQFLSELAAELGKHAVIGEGTVHRACAELQRRHTVEARSVAGGDAELRAREHERRRLTKSAHAMTTTLRSRGA
jgi:hypothetical protein